MFKFFTQSLMQGMRDGCDTPSQLHPGYVQGTKPHLPTPKDATGIRAKPSETFKVLFLSPQNTYLILTSKKCKNYNMFLFITNRLFWNLKWIKQLMQKVFIVLLIPSNIKKLIAPPLPCQTSQILMYVKILFSIN